MKVLLNSGYTLHISDKLTYKMKGITSITTSSLNNEFCEKMRKASKKNGKIICGHCYAAAALKYHKNVNNVYIKNDFLKNVILNDNDIQLIKISILSLGCRFLRFESHGEIETLTQFINYINIARALDGAGVNCALWTKNTHVLLEAKKLEIKKPSNMFIVLSNSLMNDRQNAVKLSHLFGLYIDKVFTVYNVNELKNLYNSDSDFMDLQDFINCGAKSCNLCGLCYSKNETRHINEVLKSDTKKYSNYLVSLYRKEQIENDNFYFDD